MVTKNILLETLKEIAPETNAQSWDNGGVQIFSGNETINVIMTALEVTSEVIREAVEKKADWLVVHHPLFFNDIKAVDIDEPVGKLAVELIRNNISLYATHTSFDCAPGGNNDYFAELLNLGLKREEPKDDISSLLYVSKPLLHEITLHQLFIRLQEVLKTNLPFTYAGKTDANVRRIGICCGAGGSFIKEAKDRGCDVLITGDLKYHDARLAEQTGITVIDARHYETENTFAVNMAKKLSSKLEFDVDIISFDADINPYLFWNYKK